MIMGILILKKKYTFSKFLSIAMITIGIVICTLISHNLQKKVIYFLKNEILLILKSFVLGLFGLRRTSTSSKRSSG